VPDGGYATQPPDAPQGGMQAPTWDSPTSSRPMWPCRAVGSQTVAATNSGSLGDAIWLAQVPARRSRQPAGQGDGTAHTRWRRQLHVFRGYREAPDTTHGDLDPRGGLDKRPSCANIQWRQSFCAVPESRAVDAKPRARIASMGTDVDLLPFSVDSALLSELGEKLVESVHIALLELVKNAYDADATEVTVRIIPKKKDGPDIHVIDGKKKGGPEIHIVDDGSGMTYRDVQDYWMRVATTHKTQKDVSRRYGRPRTGSKGIGRFSCRRLGAHLRLTTVGQLGGERYERTTVTFDWDRFAPGSELATITCPGSRRRLRKGSTGTELRISGAPTDEWTTRGFNYLKRQLAVLVANRGVRRPGYEEDPGFGIHLEAPGLDEEFVELREALLSAGWGTLSATVDDHGRAKCHLSALGIGNKQITSAARFPHLTGATLKIGILVADRTHMRDTGVLSKGTLGDILTAWGGVYVRYNGVRVYPYGEPGDDWLGIDRDRARRKTATGTRDLVVLARRLRGVDPGRVLLSLLSARNYVGDVELDSRATGLEMKANREGFLRGRAVAELKDFARYAIEWATVYRDYYLRLRAVEETARARRRLEQVVHRPIEPEQVVERALDYIAKEAKSLASGLPTKKRQEVGKAVSAAADAIVRVHATQTEELRHLRLIASTSTLLLIFSHEVKSFIGGLDAVLASVESIERGAQTGAAKKCRQVREGLESTKRRFIELLDMTALVGVESRNARPARLALAARLKKAVECFALVIGSYDIKLDVSGVPNRLQVGPMLEAELYAILLNVISNAIKSVIAAGGKKEIHFDATRTDGLTTIHVRDTGIGLDESIYEDVFVPFVADPQAELYPALASRLNPEDEYIVGTGSGLGLSLVREIARGRNGDVRFVPPKGEWHADLEIELP